MALRHLNLRDFVIVPSLDLPLTGGFTALTGETGAGKSILIDALQLVLGGRGDALWVREGQPRCEIGAEFDTPADARPWLLDNGFVEPDVEADALLLRRTIDAAGKSRAWINGSPATLAQLRELGEWLVDIHGQHAWQSLTRPAAVRALLDAYAGIDARPLTSAWQSWRQADAALQAAQAAQHSLAQEHERLLWQIGELDKLAPLEDEWDELNQRHARLSHAQALIDAAHAASAALEGDDGDGGALPALAQAQHALQAQRDIEPEFAALLDVLESCVAQARDAAHSLHAYLRRAEPDPDQLARLDERLGQWIALARRYRRQPQDLFATLTEWRADLARLDNAADLARLQAVADAAHDQYLTAAQATSRQRAQAAPRLATAVTAAMQKLGMQGGRFEVALQPLTEAAQHGLENVVFQVAAHAGSAPRAIERVASGGELSRLALAIAVTTSELGSVGTLVFDEVDSGVGGAVASTVGRLLHQLGRDRQVLCVTHLPQVAACADAHLLVSKRAGDGGAPVSGLVAIGGEARTREIARMLGGERISDTTLAHALEMLHPAEPTATPADRPRKTRP
ncbi:DNA repair protein RecN [Ottowia sp.]|uniref:DNA repair protein RecN n=1 Tax=Ottowia sp. TaxID=1898956 RepID=UPI002BAFDFE4|nr:DNA repair protein RecN [Ottowia sp.]HOB67212.1 DNA repair protein RecN [Ottowia sp.]HPZ56775.1 DNA repair protein RecN [Ottowia sp.]HQD47960.1 DNA repair protein RecN [Ottowia sp.]